ncbi:hypothetical protein F5Y05DRAFT_248023 [Hypoxylon sp. FL0543]|nr:hypothetical protein F5Y05DRAFT_248023 [Hypoxylon sp. FL0543]
MPGKYHEQPGLEVAPEPELPHVVEGPTIVEKPNDATQYVYEQQPQAYQGAFHHTNGYPNGPYSPSSYPPGQPATATQNQPYWGGSQAGTRVTGGFPPDNSAPSSKTILGLKKRTCWLIFGPLIALLVIGLAVGLGVGLGISHNNSNSTTTTTPTTTSSTSSTPSSTPAPTPIVCPKANGTVYQGAGDDPFLVLCDLDYNGNAVGSGTTDIGNKQASTVEDCIDICSNDSSCVGAGWGNYNGNDICWMKGSLGSSQSAQNWFFVIRQKSN